MREDYSPGDPMRAAQRNMRPAGLKRFYQAVSVGDGGGGAARFQLLLDDRPARTPGRNKLALPTRALAELVAQEWTAQGEMIAAASMPVTAIALLALDAVAGAVAATRAEILNYAGTDLLCYRAIESEKLALAQAEAFDAVLAWIEAAHGARFELAHGIVHRPQPAASLAAIGAALGAIDDPFALAALQVVTSLTGSALLALALAGRALTPAQAWRIAHVDEDFQIAQWGEDDDALARRAARWREMEAAGRVLDALAR